MKPLSTDDLNRIREIVAGRWTSIGISTYGQGSSAVTIPEIQRLIQLGYLAQETAERVDVIADGYLFGFMRRRLEQAGENADTITPERFYNIIEKQPMPLSNAQLKSIEYAKKWSGQYVKTIADRASSRVIARLATADKDWQMLEAKQIVSQKTAEAIEKHWSPHNLANMLRKETGDALMDWDKIATVEIQTATENGYADDLIETFGNDVLVAKVVNADACQFCKQLYLDANGNPKIFKLSDLMKNGDNVGKKKQQWRATLGPIHNWCMCTLIYVPENFAFNEDGILMPVKKA